MLRDARTIGHEILSCFLPQIWLRTQTNETKVISTQHSTCRLCTVAMALLRNARTELQNGTVQLCETIRNIVRIRLNYVSALSQSARQTLRYYTGRWTQESAQTRTTDWVVHIHETHLGPQNVCGNTSIFEELKCIDSSTVLCGWWNREERGGQGM